MSPQGLLTAALVVPYAGAALIPLFGSRPNIREAVTLTAASLLFLAVAGIAKATLGHVAVEATWLEILPGVAFAFRVEPLGMIFALVASSLWIVNSIYSIGYMRAHDEPRQTSYYVCFAIALGSTMGIAFAANLVTLFLFYEALTLSTFPLVIHNRDAEAMRSGRLYLLTLLGTSMALFLPAIVATWAFAGTLDFAPGGILAGKAPEGVTVLLLVLYVFGIGKAAVMPMHFWLPAAMVAPTPVSALLHAVAVVKAGVFTLLKVVVMIFGVDALAGLGQSGWLTIVAGTTVIVASLVALKQDNLKRRLAYSTVSQLSYVVLGAAILTPVSALGAAMHIVAHAFCKITLFFAAGAIHIAAHKTEVSELDGIGRRMPWTMTAFAIGALGMIGVPPTVGFVGKWFMLTGAVQSSNWLALGVILASTVLNACYFLPIVFRAFLREPQGQTHGEAPLPMVLALCATAAGAILLFFFPGVPLTLSRMMIGS